MSYSINLSDFLSEFQFYAVKGKKLQKNLNLSFYFCKEFLFNPTVRFCVKLFNQRGSSWESKPLTECIRFIQIYSSSIIVLKNKLAASPLSVLEPRSAGKVPAA